MVFLFIILLYILLVFVGVRLVVPYYGFGQSRVPQEIPDGFQKEIEHLNTISKSDKSFLQNAYNFLNQQFYGSRFEIFSKWQFAFDDIYAHKKGFLPCTVYNQLLKIMLVKSGRFTEDDIKTEVVFLNFFIHQYLKVYVDNTWIFVDPTYAKMGVPFGKRAFLFA